MRRLRQVVIAQPVSAGGTQYLVQIFQVLLNQDGTFAQQALQLAASATVNSPFSHIAAKITHCMNRRPPRTCLNDFH